MCIIVIKPKGEDFPSYDTLAQCWSANPHGAGFMWNDGHGVNIDKGYMEWEDFTSALEALKRDVDVDSTAVVMHFRIATHGEVSRECCHPFPLSSRLKDLRECVTRARVGIAHNGIISGRKTDAKQSDTMDYIMRVLTPMAAEVPRFMFSKGLKQVIEQTIDGSRMVFLTPDGEFSAVGSWQIDDGCWYSNSGYKTMKISTTWGLPYGWEDDVWYPTPMDKAPCELCEPLCPFYDDCTWDGQWYCTCEDEAMDMIEQAMKSEAMKNDYYSTE